MRSACSQNLLGLAVAEPSRVADAQRQQVGGGCVEDLSPYREGLVEFAIRPGGERGDMLLFALRGGGGSGLGSGEGGGDLLAVGRIRRTEKEVAFEAMRHDEVCVGREALPTSAIVSAWYFR